MSHSIGDIQIVGLGLTTIDILLRIGELPTWEKGGQARDLRFDGGGLVGTALVAAARLGARTGYVGTCGCDAAAQLKLGFLTCDGVDISRVMRRETPEDQVVLVCVHEQTGERVFTFRDRLDRQPLQVAELDRDYITSAGFLHIDGFHYDAALQAAAWMHAVGKPVMLDASKTDGPMDEPARAHMRTLVAVTDVLISGAGFAQALSGKLDRQAAMADVLALGPRVFVQTEGEDGCYTLTAQEYFHTPAFRVPVVDTTGAGDVFHGAYLVGLLKGWDINQTAEFACAVAALKCTRLGGRSGIPRLEDVVEFLSQRGMVIRDS